MKIVKALFAAGVAAATLVAAPAAATPVSAAANGKAIILIPLKLTNVRLLDFGTVVTSSSPGTVTIDQNTGLASPSGGVTIVTSPTDGRALFDFAGTANQTVTFSITTATPLALSDGTDTINVSSLALNTTTGTVDPTTLKVEVAVGGILDVPANQPDGDYTGKFDVTADYN